MITINKIQDMHKRLEQNHEILSVSIKTDKKYKLYMEIEISKEQPDFIENVIETAREIDIEIDIWQIIDKKKTMIVTSSDIWHL
jgi:hypothetical protein